MSDFMSTSDEKSYEKSKWWKRLWCALRYIFDGTSGLEDAEDGSEAAIPISEDSTPISEFLHHTKSYSGILELYVERIRSGMRLKFVLKIFFFIITMGVLCTIVVVFCVCMFGVTDFVSEYGEDKEATVESILLVLSTAVPSVTSLVIAFIKLPEIIAQYLFDPKEDEYMTVVIKNTQDFDHKVLGMDVSTDVSSGMDADKQGGRVPDGSIDASGGNEREQGDGETVDCELAQAEAAASSEAQTVGEEE